MPLERLIEQTRVKRIVASMVGENRLPHALLFWGPPGVGKSAAAIELARWLNCEKGSVGPCGECPSCIKFRLLEHPHFSYQMPLPAKALVDSDSGELTEAGSATLAELLKEKGADPYRQVDYPGGQFLLIGQMRSLIRWATVRSFSEAPRLALIDRADKLREEAGNALLKLLEEPPSDFILILTAETPEDILPTLRSRCHLIEFERFRREAVESELKKRGLEDGEEAVRIAHLSHGNLALALEFQQDPELTRRLHSLAIDIVRHALSKNPLELESLAETFSRKPLSEQLLVLEVISAWLRDAALIKTLGTGGSAGVIHFDRVDLLDKFVHNCPNADFVSAVEKVEEARRNLEGNAMAPLTLLVMARKLYRAVYQKKSV